jgi:ankyrin repeat protein
MSGNNCLHLFVLQTDESQASLQTLEQLLALGADVDQQNYQGNTLLHLLASIEK